MTAGMKKRLIACIILFAAALPRLWAQHNPYDIDDLCYVYFQEAERLTGLEGFAKANESLLKTAIEVGDKKAQTLYYVEKLKNETALRKNKEQVSKKDDEVVLGAMEELKKMAKALGYPQYYYYAYDLTQNYFYNHGQEVQTMELVQQMRQIAISEHDDYGMWMSNRYMVSLYVAENDYVSAKPYIEEAIETWLRSSDPTIRRQSAARLYCELANTYPIGHDSVRINVGKAEEVAKQFMDTLRCEYHKAKLAAYDQDIEAYEKSKDYCLKDLFALSKISSSAEHMFKIIDTLVYSASPNPQADVTPMKDHLREVKYVANIAENYGYKDLAFDIEKNLVSLHEAQISKANQSRITEYDARLGNDLLSARVEEEILRSQRAAHAVMYLIIAILAGVLIFSLFHIRSLKEANEKVRLADAAKTRFVQNMSHEVRTPLNAIVGFSQLLALPDGTFPEEEKEEFSSHIVNNTKMLTMLLDDILNASAMDSGGYRISYEEGEMHFMAQAAISSAEHRLQPGVRLYYAPESREPFSFRTDPRRVQQILINLLTNACKHTTAGEICLASSLTAKDGYVSYAVTDTGTGVPPEEAEKIFERFAKLNEFVQGTGLGLSICREIATKMGAKVYLDTAHPGPGARFVFEVPVNPTEE